MSDTEKRARERVRYKLSLQKRRRSIPSPGRQLRIERSGVFLRLRNTIPSAVS